MRAISLLFLMVVSSAASAASDFFTVWPGHENAPEIPGPPETPIDREWMVGLNMRGIAANAAAVAEIAVLLPDGERTFVMRSFSDIAGFEPVGDDDFQIIPGVADEDISYNWYGEADTEQMTIAVYQGVMSATITGGEKVYSVGKREGEPLLQEIDATRIPPSLEYGEQSEGRKSKPWSVPLMPFAKSSMDVVDVLVLHTPSALAQASIGGDRSVLNSRVSESFLQVESAMATSGMNTVRMRNVLTSGDLSVEVSYNEVPGNTCAGANADICRWVGHRMWLKANAGTLRNTYGADLVVMLVADQAGVVGVAYVQNLGCGVLTDYENTSGCDVGAAYDGFAFAALSVQYATSFQVFAHETGHQFGMQHQTAAGITPAYSWSFAKTRAGGTSQTVVGGLSLTRNLQYSNPNVFFIGTAEASGDANRFNTRTGACLAPAMSDFRSPGQVFTVFWDGFESPLVPVDGC
jgi:hypothetical protein